LIVTLLGESMPKIKIEIDATSSELIEIILGLAKASVAKSGTKSVNQRRAGKLRTARIMRHKKVPKPQATKPKAVHETRGRRWRKKEERWLEDYIKTNAVSRAVIEDAFYAEFGYRRSFSSLNGKAFDLRKK